MVVRTAVSTQSITADELESYRLELTGYCYRMLASPYDAEDAVQETMIRGWRGLERFEDRPADNGGLRAWLYRIATNVCLDMLKGRRKRALPIELGPAGAGTSAMGSPRAEATWVQPILDRMFTGASGDPADEVIGRETVRLAFVAALQHLAPRQRAVLILRDVLSWRASEVALLLETSEEAVNGVLKRARATIASANLASARPDSPEIESELLANYIDAFQRDDVEALVALLHEDAIITMPPFELWIQGIAGIRTFLASMHAEAGRDRVLALSANGCPALAVYRPNRSGAFVPYALMVLEVARDRISAIHAFLDTSLFPVFGLPLGDQFLPLPQL
jgi:RNA polymerase sigma-70 factor, ECF subfamily